MGVMVLALSGCSVTSNVKDFVNKVLNESPKIDVQQVPECPYESKVTCGSYVITRDSNGHVIKVEPIKR